MEKPNVVAILRPGESNNDEKMQFKALLSSICKIFRDVSTEELEIPIEQNKVGLVQRRQKR